MSPRWQQTAMIETSPSKRSTATVGFALMASLGFAISLVIVGQAQAAKTSQVDVLVLYTPGAEALYADVNTRINQLVSVTNQIFSDSDVHMQLRLVHTQRVSFSDSAGSFEALKSVSYPRVHSLASQASALRDTYGADLVVFMRPYSGDGICGIAWMLGRHTNGNFSAYHASMAFSHVSINCSDYVMAHELGHNMGLAHSYQQNQRGYTYRHSIGHGRTGDFVTVMAYQSAYKTNNKIYKFSNSRQTDCNGRRCGRRIGRKKGADAANSLQRTRFVFQDFTDGSTLPPPTDLRLVYPNKVPRGIRKNKEIVIEWDASAAISGVTVQYKKYWRVGTTRFEDQEWTTIANDVASGSQAWRVPSEFSKHGKFRIRLIGLGQNGSQKLITSGRKIKARKARKQ